jgi:peptide/nickel transport system substrate-binding protein
MLLLVSAILFALCASHASAASEPGAITLVTSAELPNLEPFDSVRGHIGQLLIKNVVESVVIRNPEEGKFEPGLATAWKQIDAQTWQFSLRKGVKFHDGADFDAKAVIFNFNRLYNKGVMSQVRSRYFSDIVLDVKALDSHTVEIKTNKPVPLFMTMLSLLSICSPNTPMALTRNPIGTGPYRFVKWDAGQQIVFERFDGYWGQKPQVQKATYLWRSESAVRAAMVLIGEADLAMSIAPQDVNRPDMDYSYFNSETTFYRIGGAWEPPLNDRRVRQALNYAIDRKSLVGSIISKDVMPATHIVPPSTVGYNPDLKLWPYDPQKAKQLLDEARRDGVPVDKEIALVARPGMFPNDIEFAEAVMTMYKAVGFNIRLRTLEYAVFNRHREKPYPPGPYILQNMHDNTQGDPAFSVFRYYHCKGDTSNTCDATMDDLIDRAQAATGDQRKSLWQAGFKRVYEDLVSNVHLYHMVGYLRVGKRINFKPTIATTNEIPLSQITFK